MSFMVEVTTAGDNGHFTANSLRFASEAEASEYGQHLANRWLAVTDWHTTKTTDPVTARWDGGKVTYGMKEANDAV